MEERVFEFRVNEVDYELAVGKCAVALFYKNPEVDYIAINMTGEDDDTTRIFNTDLARWAAGFAPVYDEEEQEWYYPSTFWELDGRDQTFREAMGWNPTTILKDEPFDWELDRYVYLKTQDVDNEITKFLGDNDGKTS